MGDPGRTEYHESGVDKVSRYETRDGPAQRTPNGSVSGRLSYVSRCNGARSRIGFEPATWHLTCSTRWLPAA
jgi:hypothetical protein